MNADFNMRLGIQRRPIALLICLLDTEILTLLHEIEGKLHCTALFSYVQTHFLGLNKHETEKILKLQG